MDIGAMKVYVVYYESIKRELKIRGIYECRCDERLQTKTKRFTLPYTGLVLELEQLKTKQSILKIKKSFFLFLKKFSWTLEAIFSRSNEVRSCFARPWLCRRRIGVHVRCVSYRTISDACDDARCISFPLCFQRSTLLPNSTAYTPCGRVSP